jgi:hypothetical protein
MSDFEVRKGVLYPGKLTEKTTKEDMIQMILKKQSSAKKTLEDFVTCDFENASANSTAISTWKAAVREANARIEYIHAPYWLVDIFNWHGQDIINKGKVTSFYASFFSDRTQKAHKLLLRPGVDFKVLGEGESYPDLDFGKKDSAGNALENDFVVDDYFSFLRHIPLSEYSNISEELAK